jgi:hypothetical protein
MNSTTTRRTLVTGLAGVAVLTQATQAAPTHVANADPIFAAIERHKAAYRLSSECSMRGANYPDFGDGHDPVVHKQIHDAEAAATKADKKAAFALTTTQPTTMAGVLALMRYVEDFNAGAFVLEDWGASRPFFWPETEDEDGIDKFGYALFANVRRSLNALAVRS